MTLKRQPLKISDRRRFLIAAMERLSGNAHISFEGDLGGCKFAALPDASEDETAVLQRNTTRPKQDFVVLPLRTDNMKAISSAMGGTIPKAILHIQIERDGQLELGLYDNFQMVGFGETLDVSFYEQLENDGVAKRRSLQS